MSSLGGQRFNESTERTLRFLRRAPVLSIRKRPKRAWLHQNSVENALVHIRNLIYVPFRNRKGFSWRVSSVEDHFHRRPTKLVIPKPAFFAGEGSAFAFEVAIDRSSNE
jgi:hypothetical protein